MTFTYRRIHLLFGILIFSIAATVYCLTIEPTASFWDCPEFIISAYKLEVGHSPGAPFFMLTANLFTQLTSDPALAARMINYMSALTSAFTILLLYLSITRLTRKLISGKREPQRISDIMLIISSGIVGSLAYTFSDTFWFSAVEAEVYAYSSLFTALVFWLILKWEDDFDTIYADRWLILIAYLIGLSIGVHILNFLCLPAIVLVYYYKKNPDAGLKGSVLALIFSMVLVAIILYGIIPGTVKVAGWFELFFVNRLELPFNSGLIFYLVLLLTLFGWSIYEARKQGSLFRIKLSFILVIGMLGIPFYIYGSSGILIGLTLLAILAFYLYSGKIKPRYQLSIRAIHTSLLCLLMIIVGFSSYGVILIRSSANTPMDQNSPEDIFTLGDYLSRKQYGQRPLFYGQAYSSERKLKIENNYCMTEYKETTPEYIRKVKATPNEKDSYVISGYAMEEVFAQNMLFPRMYSREHSSWGPNQTNLYKQWVDIKGNDIPFDKCGETVMVNMPTQWENFKFFMSYQLNFMYWRYFLWNFVGRQNDIQGYGELENGNWITGISFIDHWLVGNQELIPTELKNNKGRNVYYGLPLLLGIIGLLWQLKKGKKGIHSFTIVFFLFFMTGIAIVIYLNQTPMQARERDYAYAGSFYAFAIWIGMGVAGIADLLRKKLNKKQAAAIASIFCILIPIQMGTQTWDDHDRSLRYSWRDIGHNYLASASPNNHPVVFTMADNDTFPLWYNQEVEGFRTDIRTCNMGYLWKDWYIDQMKRDAYDSPKLPIAWKREQYITGTPEVYFVRPEMAQKIDSFYQTDPEQARKDFGENPYELKNVLKYWLRSDNEQLRFIPTDSLVVKVNKEAILQSDMQIPDSLQGEIPEYMHLSLKGKRYLSKSELMMLETLSGSNWERPLYISTTVASEHYFCFDNYLRQEGWLYRITPFDTKKINDRLDAEKTYDCLMNKFKWGGIENLKMFLDSYTARWYSINRKLFASVVKQFIKEGKQEQAISALNHCSKVIPVHQLPYNYMNGSLDLAACYYKLKDIEKGDEITSSLIHTSIEYIQWYLSMDNHHWRSTAGSCYDHFYILNQSLKLMKEQSPEASIPCSHAFEQLWEAFEAKK
ncbi:protein O-mannosyl-transferase family [Bacteroides sp. 224]|uniref:protein O-mannosyl-transferase family n=1 Tax=Bacteroides sp. 224 TaxID=2302936 RepID=UPI0013D5D9C5|nr:DUF2723 domain-containing protein [Bacteroides sp. 224]NDV66959.1 DUF2723 domain-containing protein [Bacteroides sp. 224]